MKELVCTYPTLAVERYLIYVGAVQGVLEKRDQKRTSWLFPEEISETVHMSGARDITLPKGIVIYDDCRSTVMRCPTCGTPEIERFWTLTDAGKRRYICPGKDGSRCQDFTFQHIVAEIESMRASGESASLLYEIVATTLNLPDFNSLILPSNFWGLQGKHNFQVYESKRKDGQWLVLPNEHLRIRLAGSTSALRAFEVHFGNNSLARANSLLNLFLAGRVEGLQGGIHAGGEFFSFDTLRSNEPVPYWRTFSIVA